MINTHSFHIPVMGIGFTIDTPLKVSLYGIDSVISIGDDILLERMRKMYADKFNLPYTEIAVDEEDSRAKRITAYLNLINHLAKKQFENLRKAALKGNNELRKYGNLLPDGSVIKQKINSLSEGCLDLNATRQWIKDHLSMGSIDVNIMAKVDKDNYINNEKLPIEYNDAHAGLRGYAKSDLNSSIIFSAGMNPRLYAYAEQFKDFYPDENGDIKKRIILKVSDYRSAFIQGKFLAKKGLWVSEYRIESGLNCGGHAFATDGFLLGPVLEEFKNKREGLIQSTYEYLVQALIEKNCIVPKTPLSAKITAQGGVGTADEHQFLIDHYQLDSVGWGSPFLLVPEATNVDNGTLEKLALAKEEDLYLSNISPLGVPFNNLRGNTKDREKSTLIAKGRPGSSCPKKFLALDKNYTDKAICTASRQYQYLKLKELEEENTFDEDHQSKYERIVEKSCICVGLGTSALLVNNLDTKIEGDGVSVCPGPNMAYFGKRMSLKEIIDHIYGRANVIRSDRPHMFMKELSLYIDYLKDKIDETKHSINNKQVKYLSTFTINLQEGINYYNDLFMNTKDMFEEIKSDILNDLKVFSKTLQLQKIELDKLSVVA